MSDGEEPSEEKLHNEIRSLKSQVNNLEHMLENLMNMHRNVLDRLSMNSDIEKRYIRLLSLYERYGKISPSLLPDIDDPVTEAITETLLSSGQPLNITQISERLRAKRGSSSRHTVRDRLKVMESKNIVKQVDGTNGKAYALTEEIIDRWAKLLGIKI